MISTVRNYFSGYNDPAGGVSDGRQSGKSTRASGSASNYIYQSLEEAISKNGLNKRRNGGKRSSQGTSQS
jgi:hypothetical protein